jgi:hypothetical protein
LVAGLVGADRVVADVARHPNALHSIKTEITSLIIGHISFDIYHLVIVPEAEGLQMTNDI